MSLKILAVIPARAGSKGIPNKNIRIINGRPLISYMIENAINSTLISDIVVSTDSPEIEMIASKYKVDCIHRKPNLCGDEVTLDSVVYDAITRYQTDYVITLQATSPTLSVITIDSAIRYALEKGFDTVVSVVNKPHLAWVEKDGKIVPDYQERLNRQYLPKRYLETGAFVISKREIVTEKTRFGSRIGIYEVNENEAIDVDNFHDLLCVENILGEKQTAIVVDGNDTIGLGHIYRMLEVADMMYHKPTFYINSTKTEQISFGNTTYKIISYNDEDELLQFLSEGGYELVINDILDTDEAYVKRIKNLSSEVKVVNFEDMGTGRLEADLVINALYDNQSVGKELCGEKYYVAPKLYLLYDKITIRDKAKCVFVCFGGADPQKYTEMILSIISEDKYGEYKFYVVLGKAKSNHEEIAIKYRRDNISIYYDVKNMPEIISKCDIAITSRGRTCYELALLGVPTIAMAQNDRETHHSFACEENGFWYIGKHVECETMEKYLWELATSKYETRKDMQDKMLAHDLRRGRERVKRIIDSL